MSSTIKKKLIVVGDGACGKTCLLIAFCYDKFMQEYETTVFETYISDVDVDGKKVLFTLWDTAGQEAFERLRPLSYPDTDIILLCFSIENPDSFDNIPQVWIPELRKYLPKVPIILVGNKKDLRDETTKVLHIGIREPVLREDAIIMSQKIRACAYLECSAKTREGVKQIFETAARIVIRKDKQANRKCCRLL